VHFRAFLYNALVLTCNVQIHGVQIAMSCLVQPHAGLPYDEFGKKVRRLEGQKGGKILFYRLKSVLGPMVGTVIFMERFVDSMSKPVAS
jgi:hypothetical protein